MAGSSLQALLLGNQNATPSFVQCKGFCLGKGGRSFGVPILLSNTKGAVSDWEPARRGVVAGETPVQISGSGSGDRPGLPCPLFFRICPLS